MRNKNVYRIAPILGITALSILNVAPTLADGRHYSSYTEHNRGKSSTLGGNGGTFSGKRECITDFQHELGNRRLTGFTAKHGTVIDSLKIRCGSYPSYTKTYVPSWAGYTRTSAPIKATKSNSAHCDRNTFIYGVSGVIKDNVLMNVQILCSGVNELGYRSGPTNKHTTGAGSGGGFNAGEKKCPSNGIAYGVQYKSGWHLDSINLLCAYPAKAVNNTSSSPKKLYPPLPKREKTKPTF